MGNQFLEPNESHAVVPRDAFIFFLTPNDEARINARYVQGRAQDFVLRGDKNGTELPELGPWGAPGIFFFLLLASLDAFLDHFLMLL